MTLEVRPATDADIPEWLELAGEVGDLFGAEMARDPEFRRMLERNVARGSAFCVHVGGRLAGAMLFHENRIGWLAVRNEYRRRGVARALVAHSVAAADADVCVVTFGDAHPHPDAAGAPVLFASMGFEALDATSSVALDGTPRRTMVKRTWVHGPPAKVVPEIAFADEVEMHTRASTPADAAFLHQLHHAAYRDVVTRQFGIWDEQRQDEWFLQTLSDCEFSLVEVDGVLVGAIGVDERDDYVRLVELQIVPAWQGKGLGSALLHDLMLHAKTKNKPIRLRVLRENRARTLYERNGFTVTEDAGHVYVMEWQPR